MNAASKLAAMAKVLETPVPKKNFQRNQDVQGTECLLLCTFLILWVVVVIKMLSNGSQQFLLC